MAIRNDLTYYPKYLYRISSIASSSLDALPWTKITIVYLFYSLCHLWWCKPFIAWYPILYSRTIVIFRVSQRPLHFYYVLFSAITLVWDWRRIWCYQGYCISNWLGIWLTLYFRPKTRVNDVVEPLNHSSITDVYFDELNKTWSWTDIHTIELHIGKRNLKKPLLTSFQQASTSSIMFIKHISL